MPDVHDQQEARNRMDEIRIQGEMVKQLAVIAEELKQMRAVILHLDATIKGISGSIVSAAAQSRR